MCEELRKRRMDVCCLQGVRWRGPGVPFLGMKGRRYKLQWSGNSDGTWSGCVMQNLSWIVTKRTKVRNFVYSFLGI